MFSSSKAPATPGRLDGKVALVTGSARGIGAAIAKRLAADGAKVIIVDIRFDDETEANLAAIKESGGEAVTIAADLADPAAIPRLFAEAKEAFGRLDILVNNAGIMQHEEIEKVDAAHVDLHFNLNVRGYFLCIAEALKLLPKGGRIINVSSAITRMATPGASVYSATKGAIDVMTMTLGKELGPRGITVNAISPGYTETEMTDKGMDASEVKETVKMTALGRPGRPEDIADAAAFLATDDARWITGERLVAAGGLHG